MIKVYKADSPIVQAMEEIFALMQEKGISFEVVGDRIEVKMGKSHGVIIDMNSKSSQIDTFPPLCEVQVRQYNDYMYGF